ncbi:hypothetical protein KQX54_012795 [Cotesia glomerata]|uniref:OB domain-containing protein n=1 Tax=Cotesia glomerata TaxID=32391 RepID=A0AAV7ID82_COTGL|nr:hypothetical protein KQX54_012795 [Cotesia glomerata]
MSKKVQKSGLGNKNSNDNSADEKINLFTSEFLKSIKPFSPTIEIIGIIIKIVAPRKVFITKVQKECTVFKFVIKNNKSDKVQVTSWEDDIERINDIKIGSVIHIDGSYSKTIDERGIKYNDGTVPIELIIQSNTKISILREHILNEEVDDETVDYPLVDLANCFQHLNKKIRLQLYIKTNFDIIRNQKTNINSCCGSLVDKFKWKIEAKIINFEIPFTNHLTKGQHVEVIGIIDTSYHHTTVNIQSLKDIKKIDDNVMSLFELIEANKNVIIDPDNELKNKKLKSD